jgi:hypothetical protein
MKSTQSDMNMNFDGMESMAPSRSTKFSGNQYAGKQDPNKTINKGRGPVKGNDGTCHHAGFAPSTCHPDTAAVPSLPKQGSTRDSINRGSQVRTPGGVKEMPKRGRESFDMGRGPTKGNQC